MMREIKFRGQRVDTKEWIYGYLIKNNLSDNDDERVWIADYYDCPFDLISYEVISETVGQFTGLLDKNGKEIYEGDIVATHFGEMEYSEVFFEEGFFCQRFFGSAKGCQSLIMKSSSLEVMSNIHEATPEQKKEWGLQ